MTIRFGITALGVVGFLATAADSQEVRQPDTAAPPDRYATTSIVLRRGDEIRVDFSQAPVAPGEMYTIEPGDRLRLAISGGGAAAGEDAWVMPDGRIAIDPIGAIQAVGLTVDELAAAIGAALEAQGLRKPRVAVSVTEPNGIVRGFLDGLSQSLERATFRLQIHPEADLHLPGVAPMRTPSDLVTLRRALVEAYADRFGPGLTVSVNLERRVPLVVYVTGDVREPGAYPWWEGMTPFLAIAGAGGFTVTSDVTGVLVVVNAADEMRVTTLDFSPLLRREGAPAGATLDAYDVIVVPHTPSFR